MSEEKPYAVKYRDPEGNEQTGWFLDGHVYQDEAATVPVAVGSTVPTDAGWYRMTDYGGVLWAAPDQVDDQGNWVPQGNHWYRTAQDLEEKLRARPAFAYDPDADPLYQSARDRYLTDGLRAMEDAQGRAAGLSGGYGSSYALRAGQQAYREQISQLARLLPELYDRARAGYDDETARLADQLKQAAGLYDLEYQTYLDRVEAARKDRALDLENDRWERDFQRDNDHWEREFALDQQALEQKQAASAASAAESAAVRERSYAYRMAMQALQQGLRVSDSLLETAGIDKTYAETLRRWYASIRS